jgi:hypothetical protein
LRFCVAEFDTDTQNDNGPPYLSIFGEGIVPWEELHWR